MVTKEFVEELRSQFERYIQVKDRLDSKANNIIMMSATVSTLFMGLGGFLLEHVEYSSYPKIVLIGAILLVLQISLTTLTIISAFFSYRLRTYIHPISFEAFYKPDGSLNNDVLNQFKDAKSDDINDHFVTEYVKSIRSYEEQNSSQAGLIEISRWSFIASICIMPIFTYFMVLTKFP